LQTAAKAVGDRSTGQNDLFVGGEDGGAADIQLPATAPWEPLERLNQEFEALGFYLSGHPLDEYKDVLARAKVSSWREFETAARDHGHTAGLIAGIVTSCRNRRSRSGSPFAFVGFSDQSGQFEAVVFSDVMAQAADRFKVGQAVIVGVEADVDADRVRLRVQSARAIGEEVGANEARTGQDISKLRIFVSDSEPLKALGNRLKAEGRGEVSVVVMDKSSGSEVEIRLAGNYQLGPQIERAIKAVPGVVATDAG